MTTKRVPRNDGTEGHKKVYLDESEWMWIEPSPAPGLVSPEQWARVQVRLAANKQFSTGAPGERKFGADDALLYGGMARCGVIHDNGQICGNRVVPRPRAHCYDRPDGSRVMQYRCASTKLTHKACSGVYIEAEILDKAVIAALAATLQHPDNIARLARRSQLQALVKAGSLKVVTPIDEYHVFQKRLAKEEARLENYKSLSADPDIDEPTRLGYKMSALKQTAEVQRLQEDCGRARVAAARYRHVENVISDLEHYLKQWNIQSEIMALVGYTRTALRQCLEALGARVIVHQHSDDPAQPIATLQLQLTRLDFGAKMDDEQGAVDIPVTPAPPRQQPPTSEFREWFGAEAEASTVSSSSPRAVPPQGHMTTTVPPPDDRLCDSAPSDAT